MSYSKAELREIIRLCNDVRELATGVIAEGDAQRTYDPERRMYVTAPYWPYHGGSKTSGALKRRSLDLTRALADMRRS